MNLESSRFSSNWGVLDLLICGSLLSIRIYFSVGQRTDGIALISLELIRTIRKSAMAQRRKPIEHKTTFKEWLAEEGRRFKQAAEEQPLGSMARELLLRRARQAETVSRGIRVELDAAGTYDAQASDR
jgi:hypothetical protein